MHLTRNCLICTESSLQAAGYGPVVSLPGRSALNAIPMCHTPSLLEQMGKNPLITAEEHQRSVVKRLENEINEIRVKVRGVPPKVWS